MTSSGAPPPAPGWYPDPGGSAAHRYWDGARWTDALSSAIPPAGPNVARDDTRTWAVVAHLSAFLSIFLAGLAFIGPLLVYAMKKDDPYVRHHAAEALNFQLSALIYGLVLGLIFVVSLLFIVGVLLIPLLIVLAIMWLVFVCIAAVKAGEGQEYRYPLTIRFVR